MSEDQNNVKVLPEAMWPRGYDGNIRDFTVACTHVTHAVSEIGHIAKELVTRWGAVAAAPDGEDSAGRQRLRLQQPEELVATACNTATLLWEQFQKRGWLTFIPDPTPKAPKDIKGGKQVDELVDHLNDKD